MLQQYMLLNVAAVIRDLTPQLTHVTELTQQPLDYYTGYCDDSAFSAGGVWFRANAPMSPIIWRVQWPKDITNDVVSNQKNPSRRLINFDLQMTGVLLREAVLEAKIGPTAMVGIQTAIVGLDNSLAITWTTRMASCSSSLNSFRLLEDFVMGQQTI